MKTPSPHIVGDGAGIDGEGMACLNSGHFWYGDFMTGVPVAMS